VHPAPIACLEKQRLIRDFTRAVSQCLRMQSAQLMALINGDGFQFEREIDEARERRDQIKDLIQLHQQSHGC